MQGYAVTAPCVKHMPCARRAISLYALHNSIDRVRKRWLTSRLAKPGGVPTSEGVSLSVLTC